MKPLYTQAQFEKAKSIDKFACECYGCKKSFLRTKHQIQRILNPNHNNLGLYCNTSCQRKHQGGTQDVICKQCNLEFNKTNSQIKKTKNHFCSKTCAATYNNTHKTHGTRRSKLEVYLEQQLTLIYPGLNIDYNKTEAIKSELDIYIPSLNLAFELNGIFHYEPIYGKKKLDQIQNNDQRKFQACIEENISLCIIDVSGLNYFKPDKANKFLNIITEIINKIIS